MSALAEIEKNLLELPTAERERLAVKAWESLVADVDASSNPAIDPEGIELAASRDAELEAAKVTALSHEEFTRRTSGDE